MIYTTIDEQFLTTDLAALLCWGSPQQALKYILMGPHTMETANLHLGF